MKLCPLIAETGKFLCLLILTLLIFSLQMNREFIIYSHSNKAFLFINILFNP